MQRTCPKCNETKDVTNFYGRSDRSGKLQSYCKSCNHQNTLARQRALKTHALNYKGGKCEICGYSKCASALEFHHLDPLQKEFTISKSHLLSWEKHKDQFKKELDKCVLLCSNCHREAHDK